MMQGRTYHNTRQANLEDSITFYGGLDGPGGISILLRCSDSSLLFDFGYPVDYGGYFNQTLRPDPQSGLIFYLLTGLAPPILKLYRPELISELDPEALKTLWQCQDLPDPPGIALFLSHMHYDHFTFLPYLRNDIPVYMHERAALLYESYCKSGGVFGSAAQIKHMKTGQAVSSRCMTLTAYEMEHNTSGPAAVIVQMGEHVCAYTGDWKRHGEHSDRIEGFVEACRSMKVDILLSETSLVGPPGSIPPSPETEANMLSRIKRTFKDAEGLIYLSSKERNPEWFQKLVEIVQDTGRILVMDRGSAQLWFKQSESGLCDNTKAIAVLEDTTATNSESFFPTITMLQLLENKAHYVVHLTESNLLWMILLEAQGDLKGESILVESDGDVSPNTIQLLRTWINRFNIGYHKLELLVHALPDDIVWLVSAVKPKVFVPIHGYHANRIAVPGVKRFLPFPGFPMPIHDLLSAAI